MTDYEIIKYIDDGAIFYLAFFGDAVHMESTDNGVASLEFVATLEEYRRKGLARAVCITAVRDAFINGAKIITTRAFHLASLLYQSLGFKIYY